MPANHRSRERWRNQHLTAVSSSLRMGSCTNMPQSSCNFLMRIQFWSFFFKIDICPHGDQADYDNIHSMLAPLSLTKKTARFQYCREMKPNWGDSWKLLSEKGYIIYIHIYWHVKEREIYIPLIPFQQIKYNQLLMRNTRPFWSHWHLLSIFLSVSMSVLEYNLCLSLLRILDKINLFCSR